MSNIEPEEHNITLFHSVLLALGPHLCSKRNCSKQLNFVHCNFIMLLDLYKQECKLEHKEIIISVHITEWCNQEIVLHSTASFNHPCDAIIISPQIGIDCILANGSIP